MRTLPGDLWTSRICPDDGPKIVAVTLGVGVDGDTAIQSRESEIFRTPQAWVDVDLRVRAVLWQDRRRVQTWWKS